MLEQYKTVIKQGQAEIVEKKSRFIATIRPVKTEQQAREFIEEMKKKYWDATHNVFAYQIGERNEIQRFSDDGEPQGTAGMPVLDVLQREDIKNTAIVVTRYFGGTLLGTGGLVRAYGKSAKEGLLSAGICNVVLYKKFCVTISYTDSGKVQYEILQNGYELYDTIYTENVSYIVLVKFEHGDAAKHINLILFLKKMIDVTANRAVITEEPSFYGTWIDNKMEIIEN